MLLMLGPFILNSLNRIANLNYNSDVVGRSDNI